MSDQPNAELRDLDELERIWNAYWGQCQHGGDELSREDRALFDAACNHWSTLLAELRRLREENERLKAIGRDIIKHHDRGSLSPLAGDSLTIGKMRELIEPTGDGASP